MEMIEVKTAELVGPALDWAVAHAIGGERRPHRFASNADAPLHDAWVFPEGNCCRACTKWSPSTDWSQGGPLIEKYKLDIGAPMEAKAGPWSANTEWGHPLGHKGDTPLIAACRAVVAAKLGDTVRVPAALVGGEA